MLSLTQLFTLCLVYLAILFGSAYATEKAWIPRKIATHPLVRVLSLGVFTGALGLYGSLEVASYHGTSFLLYFLGMSFAFVAASLVLGPLTQIALAHKLGSLADFFAYRYPASWVGGVITLLMLAGVLPLLALQIHAVSVTMHALNQNLSEGLFSAIFCATMTLFAILFGTRHLSTRNKHEGLVLAIGLESIIKLIAFVILAIATIETSMGGFSEFREWIATHPEIITKSTSELTTGSSRALLLVFFAATVTMPHIYHMLITENEDPRVLPAARWGFPLYLLLLSLCVLPIVWGANSGTTMAAPGTLAVKMGLDLDDQSLLIVGFVAGLAASSGVLIVSTLALSSMTVNHVLLPLYRPARGTNVGLVLLSTRRILIATIMLAAYLVYKTFGAEQRLMTIGLMTFIAALQFFPGLIAAFYWRRANRYGLLAGLVAGFVVWVLAFVPQPFFTAIQISFDASLADPAWSEVIFSSLLCNTSLLVFVSLVTRQTFEEMRAASECNNDEFLVVPELLQARSVHEMQSSLAVALGARASSQEVSLALSDLRIAEDEVRPLALSQLRTQMETNLSSTLGQTVAHRIMRLTLPLTGTALDVDRIDVLESYLEIYQSRLTGLVAELDGLRRSHRQTLQDLPTAVCSVDNAMVIKSWNHALVALTGIPADQAIGSRTSQIPEPWRDLLNTFIYGDQTNRLGFELRYEKSDGASQEKIRLYLNMHKAEVFGNDAVRDHLVIVLDDLTETKRLEEQLVHKERLASIGQLAAGVAHEIGNPVTGIACIAQNLRLETSDPALKQQTEEILKQTERISSILQSLVSFAHGGKANADRHFVPVNIKQCVTEAITLLSLENRKAVSLINQTDDATGIEGDPQRMVQVFVNVLTNAVDASEENAVVRIFSRNSAEKIVTIVEDEGHGLPAIMSGDIFNAFFTTKDPGKGTGLGLAIVSTIVAEHGGSISVEPNPSKGTRFLISLPRTLSIESPSTESLSIENPSTESFSTGTTKGSLNPSDQADKPSAGQSE